MVLLAYKWFSLLYLFTGIFVPSDATSAKNKYINDNKYHPFYVSVTELAHNRKDKSIEISCKIFTDDLEATLKQNYNTPVNLADQKKETQNGNYINDYIIKHLSIIADGKPVQLKYVGFEKDSEATYCYFEGTNIPSVKKMDIENSILQDFTNQQINIMHVTINGKRQSSKLDFPNKKASFNF
jgi:hypothetical protein